MSPDTAFDEKSPEPLLLSQEDEGIKADFRLLWGKGPRQPHDGV